MCLWIIICGTSCETLQTLWKLEWSVTHSCTRGHGSGLIMWASCLGALTHRERTKMAFMQQLRKNPQIRGIILLCMTRLPIWSNDHCCLPDYFASSFADSKLQQDCRVQVCLALRCCSWRRDLMSWCSLFPPLPSSPSFSVSLGVSLSFTFLLWHAAGRPWDQGEQMLHEGGGGDAGVHADHHVLDALVHAFLLPSCSPTATWSNMAAQIALRCDQNRIFN